MRNVIIGAAAGLLCSTALAQAGGIERAVFSPAFMFETGNHAELSFGTVSPSVSGSVGGVGSGDMADSYSLMSAALKTDVSDKLSFGLIVDQPVGANVTYPSGTGYPFGGATAELTSMQVTAVGLYRLSQNVSVYAGLRANSVEGTVENVPLPSPPFPVSSYDMVAERNVAYGYLAGAAYERPDIALRVALTYVSAITHDFSATDNFPGNTPADFSSEIPESWNIDAQTGIAADTLLFGSIRWRNWSEFEIKPRGLVPLSTDNSDTVTYTLGLGRKLSDSFSGAVSIGYEPAVGGEAGNLAPTDGYTSVSLAGIYTAQNGMKVTVGGTYGRIGDATTSTINGEFTDNSYLGFGVKVGWSF